jgi:hypothetical protein
MRSLTIFILLFLFTSLGYGQTFLEGFKQYRIEKADKISNLKTRKKTKQFIQLQIIELDTIFHSYKIKKKFDFNTADTLFLIYDSPVESPFTSDIIIWSGKDTISYRQGFTTTNSFKNERTITYQPFIAKPGQPGSYKIVTERDSLITLVSKRDYTTINHLGDNQAINDGSYITIYVAYKDGGNYKIEFCFPKQFIITNTNRKE